MLGYHGCSKETAEKVLGGNPFQASTNDYDWLGEGIYFWEANPHRGREFYREQQRRKGKSGADWAVVGAVIDLGYTLDLSSSAGVRMVAQAFDDLKAVFDAAGALLPINELGDDLVLRKLDCAVVNHLHLSRHRGGLVSFDTVRAPFVEGGAAFPGSKFKAKTHVQIAVRNQKRSIRGVFRVPKDDLEEMPESLLLR